MYCKLFLKHRIKSFRFAFRGVVTMFTQGGNALVHGFATLCVVVAGIVCRITIMEWIAVAIAVGMVMAAETFNTAVELLCDKVCPKYDSMIGKIKDLSAGAVLWCALSAALIGLLVFLPYLRC